MSQNVYDILTERGFIEQCTHPEEVRELWEERSRLHFTSALTQRRTA